QMVLFPHPLPDNNSVTALHDRADTIQGGLVAWIFELDLVVAFDAQRERRLTASTSTRKAAVPGSSPA
ncbi:MAG: hypothetical protein AAF480_12650, partial [Actinomycetota bacterium]